ncbi:RNA-binding domain-containing protein [Synergistes jonesii]|uniref:RNA-binding domain-containing protein n=1 Tax=Synergistes jonesii TaxID=2754 RepID=UPI00248E035F|nr:RNA-binding domain-containing protein [Synergistes jonesii]
MLKEDEFNEFKKTTGELNEAMVSISSILNKHGHGTIYFGLKNNGSPFPFTINVSTLRDISRKIFEAIRPQIFPVIDTIDIDGIEVITVTFDGNETPYSAFGKYYIRTADEDRELSPGELRKIMIGREYEENWENHSSAETIDDVDEKTLDNFYRSATECGRLPEVGTDKEKLLYKLGVLNGTQLTNAGKYLFSANKPLLLKMAVFATDHKTTFLDIVREEGNIFQLIDAAMNYIIRNIRWSVGLSEDGIHRTETPEVPIDALREAVINSFAHARYDGSVQHEVDIFSNRISIINPGSFANSFKPEDFVTRDLHSYLRNEVIAKTLYLCKDVETFGSGLRKIYTLCGESGVSIGYQKGESYFTFEFSREDRNIISGCDTINDTTNGTISELEIKLLSWLKAAPNITTAELVKKSGKSLSTINRCVASLKNKGLIQRIGSNKSGYWKVQS